MSNKARQSRHASTSRRTPAGLQPALSPFDHVDDAADWLLLQCEAATSVVPGTVAIGVCDTCGGLVAFVERASGVQSVGSVSQHPTCPHYEQPIVWAYNLHRVEWLADDEPTP